MWCSKNMWRHPDLLPHWICNPEPGNQKGICHWSSQVTWNIEKSLSHPGTCFWEGSRSQTSTKSIHALVSYTWLDITLIGWRDAPLWWAHCRLSAGMSVQQASLWSFFGQKQLKVGLPAPPSSNMDSLIVRVHRPLADTIPASHDDSQEFVPFPHVDRNSPTGRHLEQRLKDKALKDVRALLALRQDQAQLILEDQIIQIQADTIGCDMHLLIRTGDRIPADGVIEKGSGSVDESMLTGEPVPKPVKGIRSLGERFSWTTIFKSGLRSPPNPIFRRWENDWWIQGNTVRAALADRIAGWFVPGMMVLSALAAVLWLTAFDLMSKLQSFILPDSIVINAMDQPLYLAIHVFIATLAVACPCAMGLATPMALSICTGIAAKNGFIVRNGEALQGVSVMDRLLMDKTGTLTAGTPQVTETSLTDSQISIAAGLEIFSNHPLATAIRKYAESKGIPPAADIQNVSESAGKESLNPLIRIMFWGPKIASLSSKDEKDPWS